MKKIKDFTIEEKIVVKYGNMELNINDIYEVHYLDDFSSHVTTGRLHNIIKIEEDYIIEIDGSDRYVQNLKIIYIGTINYIRNRS